MININALLFIIMQYINIMNTLLYIHYSTVLLVRLFDSVLYHIANNLIIHDAIV